LSLIGMNSTRLLLNNSCGVLSGRKPLTGIMRAQCTGAVPAVTQSVGLPAAGLCGGRLHQHVRALSGLAADRLPNVARTGPRRPRPERVIIYCTCKHDPIHAPTSTGGWPLCRQVMELCSVYRHLLWLQPHLSAGKHIAVKLYSFWANT
jgi:hypothetical protein